MRSRISTIRSLALLSLFFVALPTKSQQQNFPSGGGGTVGGTFGGSPSSGYTFTSTPITSSPFIGNFLLATATTATCNSSYSAGSGFTLIASATGTCVGLEWATAGGASSYTGAFTYGTSQLWSATISAFTTVSSPAIVQGNFTNGGVNNLAYSSNPVAGHLLVAVFDYGSNHAPITGVTDTLGNTWKLIGLRAAESATKGLGNGDFQEVWYVANCLGGGADTVTMAGPATASISIIEVSGIATSNPLVDYAYNPDSTGNVGSTTFSGAITNNQYTINAVNNVTGAIDFTGRDSAAVFRSATNAKAAVGGLIYFKNGIYPGQTSLQESVASQTNYFVNGIAAPPGVGLQVGWHIVCESANQPNYVSVSQNGCIHPILPSAYSGAQPGAVQLSGFWQRPNAAVGAKGNNQVYFVGGVCRIPDNQRTASICFDTFTASFSSHVNTVADTNIAISDQLCSGLTVPTNTNIIGYRTNQAGTDEAYFENTWAMSYYTPYNVLSNHPIMINSHAACDQNAGILAVGTSLYGGQLIHYQDIHNITGMQFNCNNAGTRFDVQNFVEEDAISGNFARTTNASENVPGNCMGKVDLTRASANGAVFNPGLFFASGSGANFKVTSSVKLIQPGLINSSSVSSATTGTSKQTLATYTFAFITSGAGPNDGPFINNNGAVFRISAWGITAANGNSKTVEIDFGGTAISTITSTANNGSIRVSVDIIVGTAANTQECDGYADDGTTHNVLRTSPGITGNANIIVNLAATTPTASGDFTFKGWTIEYLGGN